MKSTKGQIFVTLAILLVLLLAAYLPFIHQNGFLQDDWNTLFITEQRGAGSLVDHFSIDRPLRGYFGLLEYRLLGADMTGYQVFALIWRYLDAVLVFLILMLVWPGRWLQNTLICALVIIFPGFHEQPHAFDYQAHLFARMCMVFSIYASLLIFKVKNIWLKAGCILAAVVAAQVSYGLMEYYLGLEVLRVAFFYVAIYRQEISGKLKKFLLFSALFIVNCLAFIYWRMFLFEARRASVDVGGMLGEYQDFFPKLVSTTSDLFVNLYRQIVSAYYEPFTVFSKNIPTSDLLIGLALSLAVACLVVFLIRKLNTGSTIASQSSKGYSVSLILIGLAGAIGALIPIVFAGREITYVLSGDRFSYPGAIPASMLIVGLIALVKKSVVRDSLAFVLIFIGLLTQFTNDYIFRLNYIETNQTWWQLAWRAPQIEKTTLISGNVAYGMNDEDYTFWAPANMIYYPEERDLQITAEVLLDSTKAVFFAQGSDTYTRKTITFDRDFSNLLILTKTRSSCLHVIDGKHPEFSQTDPDYVREVGLLSDISRIDAASAYDPRPREDLFGPEPVKSWCYYYQKAQLARQQRNWTQTAAYGDQALDASYSPADPMEWLVFLQAFAYTGDTRYEQVKQLVVDDVYASDQACGVFSTYTEEMAGTDYQDEHERLIRDVCQ